MSVLFLLISCAFIGAAALVLHLFLGKKPKKIQLNPGDYDPDAIIFLQRWHGDIYTRILETAGCLAKESNAPVDPETMRKAIRHEVFIEHAKRNS